MHRIKVETTLKNFNKNTNAVLEIKTLLKN